jgi:protein SCO1/2
VADRDAERRPGDQHDQTFAVRSVLIGIAVVGVLVLGIGLGVGLARGDGNGASAWAGTELAEPQPKPAIVLPDTDGRPFDLQAETEGRLTILFFGYTSCPDICPANLITLDKALTTMPGDVRAAAQVVFVSVDPVRDSPDVIRSYLDQYDRSFVGLTGTADQLADAQDIAQVPRATFDEPDDSDFYTVGHASQMIAYSPDGSAHIVYPFGTRQVDWARDLPRLARGETP